MTHKELADFGVDSSLLNVRIARILRLRGNRMFTLIEVIAEIEP